MPAGMSLVDVATKPDQFPDCCALKLAAVVLLGTKLNPGTVVSVPEYTSRAPSTETIELPRAPCGVDRPQAQICPALDPNVS